MKIFFKIANHQFNTYFKVIIKIKMYVITYKVLVEIPYDGIFISMKKVFSNALRH